MKWLNQVTNKSNGLVSKNISMETTQTILDKNAACRQSLKQQINLINESQIPTTKEEKPEMIINRKKTLENKNMNVKQAAIIIQSNWRGYSDRMKIKRMNESIGILQVVIFILLFIYCDNHKKFNFRLARTVHE